MKLLILQLTSILFSGFVLSQNNIEYPTINEEIDGVLKYNFQNKLIYHTQTGEYKTFKQLYTVVDYTSGEIEKTELKSIQSENLGGMVMKTIGNDEYIYELVRFVGSSMTTKAKVAIIKRNINDLSQTSAISWVSDYGIFNAMESPNVEMVKGKEGFFLISGRQGYGDQICFVAKYDFDLNQIWKKDVGYLADEGVNIGSFSVNEKDDLLLSLAVESNTSKKWTFKSQLDKVNLVFVNFSEDGEDLTIIPTLAENLIVKNSKFTFNSTTNELTGIFITAKSVNASTDITTGIGYAFYKWNVDGEIINSTSKFFEFSDFNSTKYFQDYLTENERNEKDFKNNDGELLGIHKLRNDYFEVEFNQDGGALIVIHGFDTRRNQNSAPNDDLLSSRIVFNVSPTGDLSWLHFLPYARRRGSFFMKAFTEGKQTIIYSGEYRESFKGESFDKYVRNQPATWENIIPVKKVINNETGEVEEISIAVDGKFEDLELVRMLRDDITKEVLFIYSGNKGKTTKYVK